MRIFTVAFIAQFLNNLPYKSFDNHDHLPKIYKELGILM